MKAFREIPFSSRGRCFRRYRLLPVWFIEIPSSLTEKTSDSLHTVQSDVDVIVGVAGHPAVHLLEWMADLAAARMYWLFVEHSSLLSRQFRNTSCCLRKTL